MEFDYCQAESGVAAAEHDDPDLIRAFNQGDVYAAAAQAFYADELTEAEREMTPKEFARARSDLRSSMKPFVLAVLYGGGAKLIAEKHRIPIEAAQARIDHFLALYPRLRVGLETSAEVGEARGCALISTGLRRTFERSAPRGWVRNLLRNTPIQGGAAVVMKEAVIRLDQEFRSTSVWIVAMIHDAVLIECDVADVAWVRERVPEMMIAAFRKFYPVLRPRIDVNDVDLSCWNKDGDADSLDRFLAEASHASGPAPAPETKGRIPEWLDGNLEDPGPGLDSTLDAELRRLMTERSVSVDLADWHERFGERAAILEFDGGLDRCAAEIRARAEVMAAFEESLGAQVDVDSEPGRIVEAVLEVFSGVLVPVAPCRAEAELDASGPDSVGGRVPAGGRA